MNPLTLIAGVLTTMFGLTLIGEGWRSPGWGASSLPALHCQRCGSDQIMAGDRFCAECGIGLPGAPLMQRGSTRSLDPACDACGGSPTYVAPELRCPRHRGEGAAT